MKEFEQRKNRIEADLNQIHNNLDDYVHKVTDSVMGNLIPVDKIRRNPVKSVGLALLGGFAAGLPKIRKKKRKKTESSSGEYANPGMRYLIFAELKRIAARRVSHLIMDAVDSAISNRFGDQDDARRANSESGS